MKRKHILMLVPESVEENNALVLRGLYPQRALGEYCFLVPDLEPSPVSATPDTRDAFKGLPDMPVKEIGGAQ